MELAGPALRCGKIFQQNQTLNPARRVPPGFQGLLRVPMVVRVTVASEIPGRNDPSQACPSKDKCLN